MNSMATQVRKPPEVKPRVPLIPGKLRLTWLLPLALLPFFLLAGLRSEGQSDMTRVAVLLAPVLFYCGYGIANGRRLERKLARRQARLERDMGRRLSEITSSEVRLSRKYFETRLTQEISRSRRHDLPLCVVTVAVPWQRDRTVLTTEFIELTARYLRAEDVTGRLGRASYAMFLPHTTPAGARVVMDRLRSGFSAQDVKFGLAYLEPGRAATAEQMLDIALEEPPSSAAA